MEEQIIDWLVAIVEAEDRRNEWIEHEKQSLRFQGKTIVDTDLQVDREIVYDYITGEVIPDEQLSWGDKHLYVEDIMEDAYTVHYPYPDPPEELKWLLGDAEFEPEVARRWINENVMPL